MRHRSLTELDGLSDQELAKLRSELLAEVLHVPHYCAVSSGERWSLIDQLQTIAWIEGYRRGAIARVLLADDGAGAA